MFCFVLQRVFICISINRLLHNRGPGESPDVCSVSSAWYNSHAQISKLAPHWSWIHIINVNELVQWQILWIMNLYSHQLYSCIHASVMHPYLSRRVLFFFLHACLRFMWAKETLLSLLNPHIPLNVSLSCGTAPYWAHFYCLNLCTFCCTCVCVALLRMCVPIMLIFCQPRPEEGPSPPYQHW